MTILNSVERRNRRIFYAILAVFFIPMLIAWGLFYFRDQLHFATTNHGVLLRPPVADVALYEKLNAHDAQRHWLIVYVPQGVCDTACHAVADRLQAVQQVLGKQQARVKVVTLSAIEATASLSMLQHDFLGQAMTKRIYLMDPAGNFFMYYPEKTDFMGIVKDLQKVLEVSQIG